MIEEIIPNIYRTEIPLPKSPLKWLNSYIIRGDNRFMIIDTGFNREECLNEMNANLKKLGVDLNKTDIFLTHLHADHTGLAGILATATSKIYFNEIERDLIKFDSQSNNWQKMLAIYAANGFPYDGARQALGSHPARRYSNDRPIEYSIIRDGDSIDIGDFHFRCISTPGHSPGHMCLYEPIQKILVAGDLILFDITPNIAFWLEMDDALGTYLASLEKVNALETKIVLTGHRRLVHNHRLRIKELQEHHQQRLNEVLVALKEGEKNVLQITPLIHWDIDAKSWEAFPPLQKWFAFGEALAHVRYLEIRGKIKRITRDGKITYSLT
ncbi:MAG: MBL fold metallo-hydrolase [Dehalococcoidales bacterium]|nr:MBL fold metallo-hydrolase [Dehalococcoidales bacterium]